MSATAATESTELRLRANANGLVLFGLVPTGILVLSILASHHWPSFGLGFRLGLVVASTTLTVTYFRRRSWMKRIGPQENDFWEANVRARGRNGVRRDLIALVVFAIFVRRSLWAGSETMLGGSVALLLACLADLALSLEATRR